VIADIEPVNATGSKEPARLDRDFEADCPNQKWLADFPYIWTAQGWMYVAVVLDLFSRRVVGWSMKAERDATLVMDALMMAVWRRGPRRTPCCITRTRDRNTPASSFSACWPTTVSLVP